MANLQTLAAMKNTENGDKSFNTTGNKLLDILFMSEFWQYNLDNLPYIGNDDIAKIFAMFMRDARYGMGRRDLGRQLMKNTGCSYEDILLAGRADDIWQMTKNSKDKFEFYNALEFLKNEIIKGNDLVKKWMPRYSSKNLAVAREIASYWFPYLSTKNGARKCAYGKFIKCDSTVEQKLSRHDNDAIKFEHVPSLASTKYAHTFATKDAFKDRYAKFLEDVKEGKKSIHMSTTTPYDIYKNRNVEGFDATIFFDQLPKISGSFLPVVDTSGSMNDMNDSMGKALAIGHYLAKCSTYMNGHVLSFSSKPTLLELGVPNTFFKYSSYFQNTNVHTQTLYATDQYNREIESMHTGDCSNTDFKAVCELIKGLDKYNAPDWIVVLSDMEFDDGSNTSLEETMKIFKENGLNTKIVWWNFNSRNATVPQMKEGGNIYISGYSPMLLKYLESGFDGEAFLNKLLIEYAKNISK